MRKCALIIANWTYEDTLLRGLVAPSQDAESLAEVLSNKEIGEFEVQVLTNAPSYRICEDIEGFFGDRERDDLMLFYFSGHGVTDDDGQLYYAASNTLHKRLRSTAVAASWVNGIMNGCRSRRQILLLDCCHSGAVGRTKAAASVNVSKYFTGETPEEGRGKFILTASDAFQYSFEGEAVEGKAVNSVFTEAVIEGLRTGRADLDGDGQITLDELYSYVYARVRERSSQQTPRKWASDVEGAVVIAANPSPAEAPLPEDLQSAIDSFVVEARVKAVERLDTFLRGKHRGRALTAHKMMITLANDDSRRVSSAAEQCLAAHSGAIAAVEAEAKRVASEKAEAAERDRLERAERERIARENAEADRVATDRAERERIAKEKAEAEERACRERGESERVAKEKAESERRDLAEQAKAAERDRREQAERQRLAAEEAEADRKRVVEKAEGVGREKADAERIAKEEADAKRAAEQAKAAERMHDELIELERGARQQVEAQEVAEEDLPIVQAPAISVSQLLDEGPFTLYQIRVIVLSAACVLLDGFSNQLITFCTPYFANQINLLSGDFALAGVAAVLGMCLGGMCSGICADRFGRRWVLIACVLLLGLSNCAITLATSVYSFNVLRFIASLGVGGVIPIASTLVAEFVPLRRRVLAVTATVACIPLGVLFASLLARHIASFDTGLLLLTCGAPPIVLFVLLLIVLPETPCFLVRRPDQLPKLERLLARMTNGVVASKGFTDQSDHAATGAENLLSLFNAHYRRDTVALWFAFFMCIFVGFNALFWLRVAFSFSFIAAAYPAYNLAGVIGAILCAFVIARLGSRWPMLTCCAAAVVTLLFERQMMIGHYPLSPPLFGVGILGFFVNAIQCTMFALSAHIYPGSIRATGVAAAFTLGSLGSFGPLILRRFLIEMGPFGWIFPVTLLMLAVATVFLFIALALVRHHIPPPKQGAVTRLPVF